MHLLQHGSYGSLCSSCDRSETWNFRVSRFDNPHDIKLEFYSRERNENGQQVRQITPFSQVFGNVGIAGLCIRLFGIPHRPYGNSEHLHQTIT